MRTILILFAILFSTIIYAQQSGIEEAPGLTSIPATTNVTDTFNLQFQFPCTAFVGEYGIESDGQFIYVTQWLDDSIAKYDMTGAVVDTFTIPGVSNVRDLAWDGTYFYGSPNDFKIYVMDFTTKTLVATYYTDMKIRGIAYDEDTDALWISEHWSPKFFKLDKTSGATLDTLTVSGITLDAISGLAYDNDSPGGPYLWGFSQDSTGAIIIKYDIPNAAQTGNMIDVSSLAIGAPYAGGLFIEPISGMPGITIGGMIQNDQIFALELGYANTLVGIEEGEIMDIKLYPNPVKDYLNIEVRGEGNYSVNIYNQLGQKLIQEQLYSDDVIRISTSLLEQGVYFLELSNDSDNFGRTTFLKAE